MRKNLSSNVPLFKKGYFVGYLVIFLLSICCQIGCRKDIVIIHKKELPKAQKEALLILPGFGAKFNGTKSMKRYFSEYSFDLYIPDYISRKSVNATVDNFDRFYRKHRLSEYKKIHILSYIVGSWTINRHLETQKEHNIATIIYDRSPLQERAPYAAVKDNPHLAKLFAGNMIADFDQTPYPPMTQPGINVGIIVENRATKFIRKHRKTALEKGPLTWDAGQFRQTHADLIYTWLNHDEMYSRFDVIGPEILHFIENGAFSGQARRRPYSDDPFSKKALQD